MIRKTSKRRGTSVIAALIALCAVVGYGLTEWAPLDNEPQAVPSRQREERDTDSRCEKETHQFDI